MWKAALVIFALSTSVSQAAEFSVASEGLARVVSIKGTINEGDGLKFLAYMREIVSGKQYVSRLVLHSDGGRVYDAHQMAYLTRALMLDTEVLAGEKCVSACFEIFTAGKNLYVGRGAKVAGHRLSLDGKENRTTDRLNRVYAKMMLDFNTPEYIVKRIMATPPARMYYLDAKDLNELGAVARED